MTYENLELLREQEKERKDAEHDNGWVCFKLHKKWSYAASWEYVKGFCAALAEYPAGYKSIEQCFKEYFNESEVKELMYIIRCNHKSDPSFYRWPIIPITENKNDPYYYFNDVGFNCED